MSELSALLIAGSGEADSYQRDLFEPKVRSTVRYADPAAWITATAVARALSGAQELLAAWRHEIGMIAISDQGPGAIDGPGSADGTTGFSSPLHYAASSPGRWWEFPDRLRIAWTNDESDYGPAGWPSRGPDLVRGLAGAEGRQADGCGRLPRLQLRRNPESRNAPGAAWIAGFRRAADRAGSGLAGGRRSRRWSRRMKNFLSPHLLDSFVERTVEALPDGLPHTSPDCAALGKAWRQHGLRPGDLVLLCLPNSRELLHQFFGVLMAGGVPALLPPIMPAARLREIATAMGAFAIGALRLPTGDLGALSAAIGPLRIALLKPPLEPVGAPGEIVLMTSGTSGVSSGCVFDFDAILLNGQRHANAIGQTAEDTVLVNLPLFFSFALSSQALASLTRGNRLIISGPPFNLAGYQQALNQFGVTVSSLTPVHIRSFFQSDPGALTGLRVCRWVATRWRRSWSPA